MKQVFQQTKKETKGTNQSFLMISGKNAKAQGRQLLKAVGHSAEGVFSILAGPKIYRQVSPERYEEVRRFF